MENIIEPSRHDSLVPLSKSSSILQSEVVHNSVYLSSNCNHFSAKFLWNINGAKLEVFSYDYKCKSRLISLFDFGEIFADPSIAISNVIRLTDHFEVASKFRHPYKLIVILSLPDNKSYICIVNVRLNNIINTIDFPFAITSAEIVMNGPPISSVSKWPLVPELACMNGILAVGCDGGLVFFIDLMLDSYSPIPLIPKQISIVTSNANIDLESKRRTANFHNQVVCVPLNTDAKSKGKFNYRTNDGNILASYATNFVYVSSIHFIPQLAIICIGYNFGCFHLYNLNSFKLECSCGLDPDLLPIVSFAFQAPENDPKNYSYLWVVRGFNNRTPNLEETKHQSCSIAFMYMLVHKNKEYIHHYGTLYTNFSLCFCKFEIPLASNPYDKNSHQYSSSKLLDMFTIQQISSLKLTDEDSSPIDFNILLIGWQSQTNTTKKINNYFMLFDLNQWYKAETPKGFYVEEGICPFISIYSLDPISKLFASDSIQAIYLQNSSLVKYSSNQFYLDIHSYPASLSFNVLIASKTKLCSAHYSGFQKQLLSQFTKIGPNLLLEPEDFVGKCLQYGLVPPDNYQIVHGLSNEIKPKRELLLNVALENGQLNFLVKTVQEWSTGELANLGCDSKQLLNWTWNKLISVKNSIDTLTKPLFDFSGIEMTPSQKVRLFSHEADLASLSILLKQLRVNSVMLTEIGFNQLVARSEIVELIRKYLKIILHFMEYGLLPESETTDESFSSYSYLNLSNFYEKRRAEFISINPSMFKSNDVLIIDIIIRHLDPELLKLWRGDGSNSESGMYPPPNLHSLIRIFLIETIPYVYKEAILLYFLLDFCECLSEQHIYMAQKISVFIASLNMSEGIRNFVQGLWSLDHRHYGTALQLLTHPVVTSSMTEFKLEIVMFNNIMQRIVELFLFENQFKSALIFTQSCGHFLIDTEQNESLYIQMLLLNGNVTEALTFQRQRRSESNSNQILMKLFFICEKTNNLIHVCRHSLDSFEESVFVDYLHFSSHENSKQILILYFVLNNKLLEAINVTKEFINQFDMSLDKNRRIVDLMEAYSSKIPNSLINLADEIANIISNYDPSLTHQTISSGKSDQMIKIIPKHRKVKQISSSLSIEKLLEMNETELKKQINSSETPLQKTKQRPLYLSPSVTRSAHSRGGVTKAKNQSKDLFQLLKTPDIIRKIDCSSQSLSIPDSPRRPSILKHGSGLDDSESDRISVNSQHRVSFTFAKSKAKLTNKNSAKKIQETSINEECVTKNFEQNMEKLSEFEDDDTATNTDQSEFDDQSTSSEQSRRRTRKSADTPTHRMKLRSKKQ